MNSYFNPKDHRIKTVFFMWASYKLLSKYCSKDYKKNHATNGPKNCPKYHAQKIYIKSTLLLICTCFLKYGLRWKDFDKLRVLFISNLNFADYTGCKNQVWSSLKFIFENSFKKNQVQINKGYIWQHSLCIEDWN